MLFSLHMFETRIVQEDLETMVGKMRSDAETLSGKNILIAGGSGFLGRHIIALLRRLNDGLLRQPCTVISLDNHITGGDARDATHLDDPHVIDEWADVSLPLPERTDIHYIIHAAGFTSPMHHKKYLLESIRAAVWGTHNLLELARKNPGLEGFLFVSSSDVYGNPEGAAVPTPEGYMGTVSRDLSRAANEESKRLGETLVHYFAHRYAIPATIVRPFHIYGPGMRHEDRRPIPYFAYQALNGRPIPIYGDGAVMRAHCYVTDAIPALLKVMLNGQPGEAYNVGNPTSFVSMNDLARAFTELIPGSAFQYVAYHELYPSGEADRSAPRVEKIEKLFGYMPEVDLRTGLGRFVQWASEQESYRATRVRSEDIRIND